MRHDCKSAGGAHASTSLGESIWETLDFCVDTGEMVIIEAESGRGKSEAAKARQSAHRGQAIYFEAHSKITEGSFFHELSKACNTGASQSLSGAKRQARVAEFLQSPGLMVIIDEARYLLPDTLRLRSYPRLIDWLYSKLSNHGVPVTLVCTPTFSAKAECVKRRTRWNSVQFFRRVKRFMQLADRLSIEDLNTVARSLFPDGTSSAAEAFAVYRNENQNRSTPCKTRCVRRDCWHREMAASVCGYRIGKRPRRPWMRTRQQRITRWDGAP